VASVIDLFRINARTANLEIRLSDQLTPAWQEWTGYAGYVTQVLLNLLSNIERYAYPDGQGGLVEITLAVAQTTQEQGFTLVVQDYGAGMTQDQVAHIFDPFFTTGRSKGGAGLGMTIVHNLVTEALQGKIEIISTPGTGARVALFLPKVISRQVDR
jgi:signal transduction histidine kinase